MKRLLLSLLSGMLLCAAAPISHAQDLTTDRVSVRFSNPEQPGQLVVNNLRGDLTVQGYAGDEVVITATLREQDETAEKMKIERLTKMARQAYEAAARSYSRRRSATTTYKKPPQEEDPAEGLSLVSNRSTGLEVEEHDNVLQVKTNNDIVDVTIRVPVNTSLRINARFGRDVTVEGVIGEIEIHASRTINLKEISGAVIANVGGAGDISATFVSVDPEKPMSFSTLMGDIDVTLPPDVQATLVMNANNIYTNFDIEEHRSGDITEEDTREDGGKYTYRRDPTTHGTLGGGGPEFRFLTRTGNLYLRKRE